MPAFANLIIDSQLFAILLVFVAAAIIQLVYYTGIYSRLVFYRKKPVPPSDEPVSVIICARNEADNLDLYLPEILTQDYPNYEVVVVNDCSSDQTEDVLKKYGEQYPHLKTTTIKEDKKFGHGKKLAVTIGIKAARYDRLVFIDGDCKPESNQWLSLMSSHFSDKTSIVLGYGGYYPQPGFLNKYIRYDTLMIALQYFSFALCKMPYMGVGRNLAYKRSLFYSGSGFSNHFHLASGDDDLFVNENATKFNTAIEIEHQSHTRTAPKESFDRWFFQKKRHFSTSSLYKKSHKILLGLEPISRLIFYASFITLLIFPSYRPWVALLFGLRLAIQLFIIKKAMIRFHEKNLLLISLLFDLMSLFFNFGLLNIEPYQTDKLSMEVNLNLSEKAQRDYMLVQRATEGDQRAYAELMGRYRDAIYYMLLKMVNNASDAEDLTIEAFGKAFKNITQYAPNYAFSTWLFKIATNNCIDFIRKKKANHVSLDHSNEEHEKATKDIQAPIMDPEETLINEQKIHLMRSLVSKLKPRYRKLIELRYFNELSYEEIAEELELPIGTVKAQLFRARELLFNILKNTTGKM